jgi:hypothetical protein
MNAIRRSFPALLGVAAACAVSPLGAGACAGTQRPGPGGPASSASASAAASFAPSQGLSPIEARFRAGACSVSVSSAVGGTYRFAPAERERVGRSLETAAAPCMGRGAGAQGTVYLSGQVDPSGKVSDLVPAPGGAMSSDVARCLTEAVGRAMLAPPLDGPSALLLLVVSECGGG